MEINRSTNVGVYTILLLLVAVTETASDIGRGSLPSDTPNVSVEWEIKPKAAIRRYPRADCRCKNACSNFDELFPIEKYVKIPFGESGCYITDKDWICSE